MTTATPIEGTERTWNPVTGRAKVSPGCRAQPCRGGGPGARPMRASGVEGIKRQADAPAPPSSSSHGAPGAPTARGGARRRTGGCSGGGLGMRCRGG